MQTSEIIRSRRLALGLSQMELAASVGLEVRQIGRYENGSSMPSLPAARAIADRLGISLDELAGGDETLSGTWWSCWQGLTSQDQLTQVHLVQRGQQLEISSDPGANEADAPIRLQCELRIVGDEMLGWYVLEGSQHHGKGTMTLQRHETGLVGIWLTASLRDGFRDGYLALARTRTVVSEMIMKLLSKGRTRHDKTGPSQGSRADATE